MLTYRLDASSYVLSSGTNGCNSFHDMYGVFIEDPTFTNHFMLLMDAVRKGNAENCRDLASHFRDINAQQCYNTSDIGSESPLHRAVKNGKLVCAKILLDYGADPELENNRGQSARTLAHESKNNEMIFLFSQIPRFSTVEIMSTSYKTDTCVRGKLITDKVIWKIPLKVWNYKGILKFGPSVSDLADYSFHLCNHEAKVQVELEFEIRRIKGKKHMGYQILLKNEKDISAQGMMLKITTPPSKYRQRRNHRFYEIPQTETQSESQSECFIS